MEMRRRQFCLTVTAGVATTMIPGRPAEARAIPGLGKAMRKYGLLVLVVGAAVLGAGVFGVGPLLPGNPWIIGGGALVFALGLSSVAIGAFICIKYPASCSTGGGVGDIAAVARGEDPTLARPCLVDEDAIINLPLQHVPEAGDEVRDAITAANEMIDAYNRLRSDALDGRDLGDALGNLRQSVEQVRSEISRLDDGGYRVNPTDIAAGRLRLQNDGLPPAGADYLRACGFSNAAMENLRQQIVDTDVSQEEGKSLGELLGEIASGVPNASDLPATPPLVPVPDPEVDR